MASITLLCALPTPHPTPISFQGFPLSSVVLLALNCLTLYASKTVLGSRLGGRDGVGMEGRVAAEKLVCLGPPLRC